MRLSAVRNVGVTSLGPRWCVEPWNVQVGCKQAKQPQIGGDLTLKVFNMSRRTALAEQCLCCCMSLGWKARYTSTVRADAAHATAVPCWFGLCWHGSAGAAVAVPRPSLAATPTPASLAPAVFS